jgi:hypothetical protein
MRALPGGEVVHDLRFAVGNVEELPDWDALVAATTEPTSESFQERPPPIDVEQALASVKDPELREELRRLCARRKQP